MLEERDSITQQLRELEVKLKEERSKEQERPRKRRGHSRSNSPDEHSQRSQSQEGSSHRERGRSASGDRGDQHKRSHGPKVMSPRSKSSPQEELTKELIRALREGRRKVYGAAGTFGDRPC